MINLKSFLNFKFRINRQEKKTLAVLVLLLVLTLPFQNCGNFEVNDNPVSNDQSSLSTSGSGGNQTPPPGGGTGNPPPPPPPGGVDPAIEAARIARCQGYIQKPIIANAASINSTVLNLKSGLGSRSGDQNSADVAVQTDSSKGISNPAGSTADNCVPTTSLMVAVIKNNASYPATFTAGIDMNGNAPATASQDDKADAVLNSQINNGNSANFGSNNSVPFRVNIDDANRTLRCSSGSLYFRVIIRVTAGVATNPNRLDSDPAYVRANFSSACWSESKLAMTINSASAIAGHKVAISGNWAAVLAPKEDNMGAVYLFSKSGSSWNFSQKLAMPGATSLQVLSNVAFGAGYLAVSNSSFGGIGRVFIFQNSGSSWNHVQTISPVDSSVFDQKFGIGLAIGSNFLAVGATDIASGTSTGKVYIYYANGSGFTYSQTLSPPSEAYQFGQTIAASSNRIAVGAPYSPNGTFSGAAFVFSDSGGTWSAVTVQKPSSLSSAANFGKSISLDGNHLAVGADRHDVGANTDAGAVYYYANYSNAVTHTVNGNTANAQLGSAVALSADSLFVGASGGSPEDGNGNSGFVSRLQLSNLAAGGNSTTNAANGGFVQFSQDSRATESFGSSLASDGGSNVIIGAPGKSDPLSRSGAAYVYSVVP